MIKTYKEIPFAVRSSGLLMLMVCLTLLLNGCSDEKGPTVPTNLTGGEEITIERNQEIRVGMLSISPSPKLFFSITRGGYKIFLGAETTPSHSGFVGQTWHVKVDEDKSIILVNQNGKEFNVPQEKITVTPAGDIVEDGHILIGEMKKELRQYRGSIEIAVENDKVLAINIIPMEEYLLGVVPAEMLPTWHEDALKAQAVAARSYAYFNLDRFEYRNFDLADTVISQAYAGVLAETKSTTEAVVDTEGEVILFEGNLANSLYHSTCGGTGASASEIFGLSEKSDSDQKIIDPYLRDPFDVPYLVSNRDDSPWGVYCEDSPLYRWEREYTREQLTKALRKSSFTDPGAYLSSLTITARTDSDWVDTVFVSGARDHLATGAQFRKALNQNLEPNAIPSTNFDIDFKDGKYLIEGKGFGHGVGLCQYGTKMRASEGLHYDTILEHYYPGCEIEKLSLSKGLTYFRDEGFFLLGKRRRGKDEVEGLGVDYVPDEEEEEALLSDEPWDAEDSFETSPQIIKDIPPDI